MRKTTTTIAAITILIAITAFILAGCATNRNPRIPDAVMLSEGGMRLSKDESKKLDEGRRLYLNECVRCHKLTLPDDEPTAHWRNILTRHRGRVPVTAKKYKMMFDYILTASEYLEKTESGVISR